MTDRMGRDAASNEATGSSERRAIGRALALLEAGDVERARAVLREALADERESSTAPAVLAPPWASAPSQSLSRPVDAPAFDGTLDDDEIDDAIAHAETNPDEMLSANRVVEDTLDLHSPAALDSSFDVSRHPSYATRTMLSLLEGQGRTAEANAVRAALPASRYEDDPDDAFDAPSPGASTGFGADDARRLRIVATLESWLHNVRRGMESQGRAS